MKKLYFLLIALCVFNGVNAQIINFPDANFKMKLVNASVNNSVAKNLSNAFFKIDANNNGEIEVSEAQQVSYLFIVGNPNIVTSFEGILNFTNIKTFVSAYNNTPILDLNGLKYLEYLDCNATNVSTINVSGCTNLNYLNCSLNLLTSLNITGLTNLNSLVCNGNSFLSLDASSSSNLQYLKCDSGKLTSLNVNGCANLIDLDCKTNQLTTLDVGGLTNLKALNCNSNLLTSLNVIGCTNLQDLKCNYNQLPILITTGLESLKYIDCTVNQITSLDFTKCTNIQTIYCSNNKLETLNISGLKNLITLYAESNQLTSLDVTNLTKLEILKVIDNQYTTLDVSVCSSLKGLYCANNLPLKFVFAKTGNNTLVNLFNDLNLQYVCVDDSQVAAVYNFIINNKYNCHVNSYCSFIPGGVFYTMRGSTRFDSNSNGCNVNNSYYPNLKLAFTMGNNIGNYIADVSGNYHYDVQSGAVTITPVLENPAYFTISPTTVNITFPTQASPFVQDFCIIPNGSHPDLEITLLPLVRARPGFDAIYKIIYKNKGNTTQSGSVNITFIDAVLDFITANPAVSNQTENNLSWDFISLKPFESKEITFTLNVNAPTETPAVNNGDVLSYTTTITSTNTDETPIDNTFTLYQTVVGSFDPNDKTCLEGSTITPALIGEYMHYMIRFENKGTYPAQNIVVKDMIDLSKFDILTLIPTSASHSYTTKISDGNKVEFIFENINLPYDDANNDGYLAFKIKTKPTLVVGDSFTNEASIFFDYNFPIVTNKATSTFKTLGTQDFDFSSYFTLYPNPATSVLSITSKETIEVQSIAIYNTPGQLILAIPNAQKVSKIDVSSLSTGNYFIKINSDKGTSNARFIKD